MISGVLPGVAIVLSGEMPEKNGEQKNQPGKAPQMMSCNIRRIAVKSHDHCRHCLNR
jgi:hypothetical protein